MFIKFNYTSKEIQKIKNNIIKTFNKFIINFQNNLSLDEYLNVLNNYDYIYNVIIFLQAVSPNPQIRKASIKFQTDLAEYFSKFFADINNYNVFLIIRESIYNKKENTLLLRLLNKIIKGFELSGVNLEGNRKRLFEKYNIELLKYENQFNQNIYNSNKKLILFDYEIDGLPKDFLKSKESKNNIKKYIIGTSYPEQEIIIKHSSSPTTRRKYYKMINQIGYPKNMKVLQKILNLRYNLANLLGYSNNIELKLSNNRIVKSENEINNLINRLLPKLIKNASSFYNNLKKELEDDNHNNNKVLTLSDIQYYSHKYLEKHYKINTEKIKKHFPLKYVIMRIFKIFERIFSIKIRRRNDMGSWHPSVMSYCIYDGAHVLGHLFLDLFPRAGKYNHAATFDLQNSYINEMGMRVEPVTAVVCNFDRKFMSHKEITTFCHEMGHALHNIFSKVKYGEFAGTNTEIDFVETISQFFENWVWTPKFLRFVSKPILSDSNINKIISLRNYGIGFHYLNQILYIKYDLAIHKEEKMELKKLHDIWYQIYNKLTPFINSNKIDYKYNKEIIKDLYPMCSFGHLVGYDVAYYSYLWSVIYSYEILSVFEKKGLFNPKIGKKLREVIMEKGGTEKGTELLKNFLGREPDEKFFIKKIFM